VVESVPTDDYPLRRILLLLRIRATPGLKNAEHRRIRATPGLKNAEHRRIQASGLAWKNAEYISFSVSTEAKTQLKGSKLQRGKAIPH
jgi:hypothetical protein